VVKAAADLGKKSIIPVDPRLVAELLGIELLKEKMPNSIDGLFFRTFDGIGHAIVNSSKPILRRRFTALHELAHGMGIIYLTSRE